MDGTRLALSGELGFSTVMDVLEEGRRAIASAPTAGTVLDLSGVTKSDSAGLALVVDWLRAARARGVTLAVEAAPAQLADIARVSGLESLLSREGVEGAA